MAEDDTEYISASEAKKIELNILKEFDKLCTDHGLRYVLSYGTLLGAMRHGGFIPWDDDIDVCMPREDYEKLYDLWKSNPKAFAHTLITPRDKTFPNCWFKLVDSRTVAFLDYYDNAIPHGLWVDIFPYESAKALTWKVKIIFLLLKPLEFLISVANMNPDAGESRFRVLLKKSLAPLKRVINRFAIASKMDSLTQKINNPCGSEVFFQILGDECRKSINKNDIFPVSYASFEEHMFPIPANPEKVLTDRYGNWRELPPMEQRIPHATKAKYV